MTVGNFKDHPREYISFFVIAILIIPALHMVRVSEAQSTPFDYDPMSRMGILQNTCPAFMRYFHGPFFFFRPCMPQSIQQKVPVVAPVISTDVTLTDATTTLDTSTSTATTTPDASPSATSTMPEGSAAPANEEAAESPAVADASSTSAE